MFFFSPSSSSSFLSSGLPSFLLNRLLMVNMAVKTWTSKPVHYHKLESGSEIHPGGYIKCRVKEWKRWEQSFDFLEPPFILISPDRILDVNDARSPESASEMSTFTRGGKHTHTHRHGTLTFQTRQTVSRPLAPSPHQSSRDPRPPAPQLSSARSRG